MDHFWWSESQLNRNPWWSVEKRRPGPESIAPDIPFLVTSKFITTRSLQVHWVGHLGHILWHLWFRSSTHSVIAPSTRLHQATVFIVEAPVDRIAAEFQSLPNLTRWCLGWKKWWRLSILDVHIIYIYLFMYLYIYTHSYSYYIIMTVLELEYKMWRKPPVINGADSWWHPEGPGSFDHLLAISLQECWHILFQNTTTSWLEIDFPHFFAAKNAMFGYFEWGIPPLLRQPHCMRRSGLGFGILLVALADVNLTSYLDMGICPVMVGKNSPGTGSIYIFCRCRLQIPHPKTVTFDKCRIVPHVTGLVHNTYSNYSNQLVPSLLVILGALW